MTIDFTKTMEDVSTFFTDFMKNEQSYAGEDFEEKIASIGQALAVFSACYVHQGVCKDLISRREAYRYINKMGKKYIQDAKEHFKEIEFSAGIEEIRKKREERSGMLPKLD